MPSPITHKSISGRNLLLLAGSIIFSFCILEGGCRLFFAHHLPCRKPRLFITGNEVYPWCQPKKYSRIVINKKSGGSEFAMLVPNMYFAHEYPTNWRGYFDKKNRIRYRSNNCGFRGRDLFEGDAVRDATRRQIVLLGDSFTFGEGVLLKDTYGCVLESMLNQSFPRVPSEVINFAQPGLNTYTEYIVWDMHHPLVAPDLVIVAFTPGDVMMDKIKEQEKNIITGKYLKMFEMPKGVEILLSKSKLYETLRYRVMNTFLDRKMDAVSIDDLNTIAIDGKTSAAVCRESFHHLCNVIQSKGSRFMVILIPFFIKLENDYPYEAIHNLVTDIGTSEGFPVIDLLPAFKGKKEDQFWVHPIDHHPNEIAHRMIAEYLRSNDTFRKVMREMYGFAEDQAATQHSPRGNSF